MCVQADVRALFSLTINPRYGAHDSSTDVPSKSAQSGSVFSVLLQSLYKKIDAEDIENTCANKQW